MPETPQPSWCAYIAPAATRCDAQIPDAESPAPVDTEIRLAGVNAGAMADAVGWNAELVRAGGLRLNVGRRGTGRPLLLITGIGAHIEMWSPIVGLLGDRELIAVDPPGAGRSQSSWRPLRMSGLAAVMEELLGDERHSLGALVAGERLAAVLHDLLGADLDAVAGGGEGVRAAPPRARRPSGIDVSAAEARRATTTA